MAAPNQYDQVVILRRKDDAVLRWGYWADVGKVFNTFIEYWVLRADYTGPFPSLPGLPPFPPIE